MAADVTSGLAARPTVYMTEILKGSDMILPAACQKHEGALL